MSRQVEAKIGHVLGAAEARARVEKAFAHYAMKWPMTFAWDAEKRVAFIEGGPAFLRLRGRVLVEEKLVWLEATYPLLVARSVAEAFVTKATPELEAWFR